MSDYWTEPYQADTLNRTYHMGIDLGDDNDMTAVIATMQNSSIRIVAVIRAVDHFSSAVERAGWAIRRFEYNMFGRTRPDGRPRRSGHRHRGMPAWRRRSGVWPSSNWQYRPGSVKVYVDGRPRR